MKKRFIAGMMSAAMMAGMALPVNASATDSQTMELSASVESEFTLSIPSTTAIAYNQTSTDLNGTLKVTGNVLPTQKVTVTATANPLKNSVQNTELPYKLMNGTTEFTSAEWSETELRAATPKELTLSVDITEDDWKAAKAGAYTGSIVFLAELVTEQP